MSLFRRENERKCDFCHKNSAICMATTKDSDRDICQTCIKQGMEFFNLGTVGTTKNIIMNIGAMAKLILDKDTKTLVKAGFMNTDLSLTAEGKAALDAINFLANKAELVKQAEEVIEETEDKE